MQKLLDFFETRRAQDIGKILFVLWLVLLGGNYALYILALPVRGIHHLLITFVLVFWLWSNGLPKTALNRALLASNMIVFISALAAIDQRMALENAWFWLNHSLLFLLFVDWVQRGHTEKMLRAHFIAGALLVIGGLVEYAANPGVRVASLLLIISTTGAYAAPLAVLLAGWLLEHPKNPHRRLYFLLLIGLVILVDMNNSRGALLSLAVGIAALAIWELDLKMHWLKIAFPVGIVLATGLIVVTSLLPGRITGDEQRADLWHAAASMTKDYPLTGVGPGLFGLSYNTLYTDRAEQYAQGAHNFLLNTAAELGAPGLVITLLVVILFLKQLPKQRTTLQNAALAALMGIAVHSMVDNFSDTSFVSLALLLAAMLTTTQPRLVEAVQRWHHAIVALLLSCGLLLLWSDIAQDYYERSIFLNSLSFAETAMQIDPGMHLYDLQVERLAVGAPPLLSTDFAMVGYARYWR